MLNLCNISLHDETAVADEQSHCDSNAPSIPGDEISTGFFRSVDIDKTITRNIVKDGQGAEQEEPITNIAT